jgi:hypothetical protein
MSYKYSYSSWWWTWRVPKYVEVINKIDEIYCGYCAQVWFHSQDYIEMHCQQNITFINMHLLCYNSSTNYSWLHGHRTQSERELSWGMSWRMSGENRWSYKGLREIAYTWFSLEHVTFLIWGTDIVIVTFCSCKFSSLDTLNKRLVRMFGAPVSYSECPGFTSQPEDCLS